MNCFYNGRPRAKIPRMQTKLPKMLLHPKHWAMWFFAGVLYLLVKCLPYSWLMRTGAVVGRAMEKLMPYRFLVAKTNIRLCFSGRDWQSIYSRHVTSIGKGVFEMAMAWFLPVGHFKGRVNYVGYENVDAALTSGRGVLFLGMHSTGLDFNVGLNRYPGYLMYKPVRNAVMDFIIKRSRLRHCLGVIEQQNLREVVKRLNEGSCVWYGSDQDFGHWSKSVFAPFYGVSAYTLPYYAKIAQRTHAAVIPMAGFRDEENNCFTIRYLPEISVQGLSDEQAAIAMNQAIEQLLVDFEDQYYWIHRRFKTRPAGEAPLYPKKPSHIRRDKRAAAKAKKEQKR